MEQTSSYSSAGQENSYLFSMKSKVSSQCWKEFASGPCPETDYSSPRFHILCMWDSFNITYPKVIASGNCFLHLQREDAPYVATGTCITWLWSFCVVSCALWMFCYEIVSFFDTVVKCKCLKRERTGEFLDHERQG